MSQDLIEPTPLVPLGSENSILAASINSPAVVEFSKSDTPINSDSINSSLPTPPIQEVQPIVDSALSNPIVQSIVTEPIVSESNNNSVGVVLDNVVSGAGVAIDVKMDTEMAPPSVESNGIVAAETLLLPVTPAEALPIAQSIPQELLPTLSSTPILTPPTPVAPVPVAEPVVSIPPAPIGAPEILPPPPSIPLPTLEQVSLPPAPPTFERMDSISSVVVEPPTPSVSTPVPTPTYTHIPIVPTPTLSQTAPMDVDTVMGEVSDSSLNKRSAPLEEQDHSQGEAKRARVESEASPFASTSAAIVPPPITTTSFESTAPYAPVPSSVLQSVVATPSLPSPTISPSELIATAQLPIASTSTATYPMAEVPVPTYVPQQQAYVETPVSYAPLQQLPQAAAPIVAMNGFEVPIPLEAAPLVPAVPAAEGPIAVLNKEQHKWALTLVRGLKKNRQAPPFMKPVDPVALLIPDYFRVVTRPMDLGTVETKLIATGKAMTIASKQGKIYGLDYNPGSGLWEGSAGCGEVYRTVVDFKEDLERVWENCFKYNGAKDKNPVSAMAGAIQEVAEKAFASTPYAPAIEYNPPPPQVAQPQVVQAPIPQVKSEERRQSVSARPSMETAIRPKREVQAPARIADTEEGGSSSKPARSGKVSSKTAHEQLKFCKEVMKELFKKQHAAYAFVFYAPVDYMSLNIPQYPSIVKRPIDLGTIRAKLDAGQYPVPPFKEFEADMRLLFKNCYLFNPPGTPVHEWGKLVEGVFETKWEERPLAPEYEEESDDEQLHDLERQLVALQNTIAQIKATKRTEKEQRKAAERQARPPKAPKAPRQQHTNHSEVSRNQNTMNRAASKRGRGSGMGGGAGRKKKSHKKDEWDSGEDEEATAVRSGPSKTQEVTFDMKRELAVKIVSFEGEDLEKAIDIIRRGRPELLGDANKEIELDIDQLDQSTLLALYRYVCPPSHKKAATTKRRPSNNTGGAPKRKTMDEMKESERIRDLEARLREFEGNGNSGGGDSRRGSAAANGGGDQASSDSSSEGESESESEDE